MNKAFLVNSAEELLKKLNQNEQEKKDEIVKTINNHSLTAVAAAFLPVPYADLALAVGNIWHMYVAINKIVGISFKENLMKSVGSAVVANLSSSFLSQVLVSSLKFIPGVGMVSAALLLSASNYALCTVAGWVYLQALTTLVNDKGEIATDDPDLEKKFTHAIKHSKDEAKKKKAEIQKEYVVEKKEEDNKKQQ